MYRQVVEVAVLLELISAMRGCPNSLEFSKPSGFQNVNMSKKLCGLFFTTRLLYRAYGHVARESCRMRH